jgi:hypothetical protein
VADPTKSYLKVPYDLRPAKQVERRMMLDGLRWISAVGLPISDYRYVGFGSVHFVDFVMFHKLLGLRKMTSVEISKDIKKRIKFNRPYKSVDIIMKPVSQVIPRLKRGEKHVLWLDYDDVLNDEQLQDVWQSASMLSVGSVLIVTIDVEPPKGTERPEQWKAYYEGVASTYLGSRDLEYYALSNLGRVNIDVVTKAIESGVSGRSGVDVIPIFSFLYKDGHEMLTVGCVIGGDNERSAVVSSEITKQVYYRSDFSAPAYEIRVPIITRKERVYLDNAMPCDDDWTPSDFEMDAEKVRQYREVYRFLPAYAELLL